MHLTYKTAIGEKLNPIHGSVLFKLLELCFCAAQIKPINLEPTGYRIKESKVNSIPQTKQTP